MLTLPPSTKVYVCTEAVSMRLSFDGLSQQVQSILKEDPFSGHLFVFFNRSGDKVKILYWDRSGFALWYKRLERGRYRPPRINGESVYTLTCSELGMILEGIELQDKKRHRSLITH